MLIPSDGFALWLGIERLRNIGPDVKISLIEPTNSSRELFITAYL